MLAMCAVSDTFGLILLLLARLSLAVPSGLGVSLHTRQATDKLVFCHFMVRLCLLEGALYYGANSQPH